MNHGAEPFVPRSHQRKAPGPTQPLTPPLSGQHMPPGPPPPPGQFGGRGPYPGGPGHHHHHHYNGGGYGNGYGGYSQPPPHHAHHRYGGPGGPGGPNSGGYRPGPGPSHFDPQSQAGSRPPAYAAGTPTTPLSSKLRASANEYVPPGATGSRKESPAPAADNASIASDKAAADKPQEKAAEQPSKVPMTADQLTKLNAGATPYTPTRRTPAGGGKGGAFPAAPPSETTTSDAQGESASPARRTSTTACDGFSANTSVTNPDTPLPETPTSPGSPVFKGPEDTFKTSKLAVPAKPEPPAEKKLNNTWTLYADSRPVNALALGGGFGVGGSTQDFKPAELRVVGTLEQFWRLTRSLKPPSGQAANFTFYFFRRNIRPMWEDARNASGGKICIPVWDRERASTQDRAAVDDVWWITTMALAGESLPQALLLVGAVLKIRQRSILLEIWTSSSNKDALKEIADAFRPALARAIGEQRAAAELDFFCHDSAKKASSPATSRPPRGFKSKPSKPEADLKL